MAELLTYLTRLHETPRYYGSGLYRQLKEKNIFLWSQAIAFKVLITVVPVIILATGILATGVLGPILEEEESFSTVAAFIQNFLPPDQSDQLITFLRDFAGAGNTLTLIGGLALLLSALTLFTTLRVVVGNLFQEDWHEDRSILGGYLFDLRMVGQVGLLFLLSLGLTVAVQTLDATVFKLISQVGLQFMREWIVTMLALLVPFLITTAMFFQLFYFVPKPHPPPLSTLFGAFFSAILWEAAKSAFTLFAQYAGRFDRYSGDGAEGVLGSTFGLIIAFVFWVYYSGIVLCLGGIMVLLHEKRHRSRRLAALTDADEDRAAEAASTPATRETPEPDEHPIRTATTGDQLLLLMAVFVLVMGPGRRAAAQAPLFLANEQTTTRGITFTFVDAEQYPPQFEPGTLQAQIATQTPGFWDNVKGFLPFLKPDTYPLDPIELQKDVVRLRRFYRQNGYLSPYVDYGASRLDTTENTIRIVFSIKQGPPIIIQDVAFFSPDGGYATRLFEDETRERWIDFRDRTSFKTGDRYTTFDLFRIQDQVLSWLKDRGYAFARLKTETLIDSTASTADITFALDPGPLSYFSEILIEGTEQVSEQVVRRELPFEQGDLFSNKKLIQGQRELFGLNLFQVALAEVLPTVAHPDSLRLGWQLRDSTVTVRIRVREAKLRSLTAQTGYDRARGITLNGQWAHRNFLGGARHLTLNMTALTGLPENLTSRSDETGVPRLFRGSIALRQPYLGSRSLSGIVEPFLVYERDPLLRDTDLFLNVNRRELGVNSTLIYEILPFRTVSLQYVLSRAIKFPSEDPGIAGTDATIATARDSYNKSIVTLNGTFGWTNNFLNPQRGFLVRPFIERGGGLERLLGLGRSGVEFFKTGVEIVAYIPVTRTINVGARLNGGRLWPTGVSNDPQLLHVEGSDDAVVFDPTFVQPLEDRFDPIRFYTGGSNDVRGWDLGLIGPKFNRTEFARDSTGTILYDGDLPRTTSEQYEAVGGLAKLAGNVEVRFPIPGLSNTWRVAVFLDVGQVSATVIEAQDCTRSFTEETDEGTKEIEVQCGFKDTGRLTLGNFKVGLGAGIRYETPIGYLRLDIAYKLNPDDLDLQTPRNAFLADEGLIARKKEFLRHFNLHLSLGQAF